METLAFNRTVLTTIISKDIPIRLRGSEQAVTPVDLAGTTASLDMRLKADADPSGGTTIREVFKLTYFPSIDLTGKISLNFTLTNRLGDGTNGTIISEIVEHSQDMDTFLSQAGIVRDDPSGGSVPTLSAVNKDIVTIYPGQLLAVHSSGSGVVLATSTNLGKQATMIATSQANPTFTVNYLTLGTLNLADWTQAFGSIALISPAIYYLGPTPGQLTNVPPTALDSVFIQEIGTAIDTQTVNFEPEYTIMF